VVDPTSTDQLIQLAHAADVVEGETAAAAPAPAAPAPEESRFGAGVFDEESPAQSGSPLE
jgi:hypothetical protein